MISSWRQLGQVAPSWVKLILVGLFRPLVGQEFTEGFAVILVSGDPKDILHLFTRVNVQCLATVHQGVDDGGTYRSIVVPAEQEVLPAQGQRPDGILHKVVVDAEAAVVHIAAQPWQQRKRITDGLPDATVNFGAIGLQEPAQITYLPETDAPSHSSPPNKYPRTYARIIPREIVS